MKTRQLVIPAIENFDDGGQRHCELHLAVQQPDDAEEVTILSLTIQSEGVETGVPNSDL